jgi:hypothetical protein
MLIYSIKKKHTHTHTHTQLVIASVRPRLLHGLQYALLLHINGAQCRLIQNVHPTASISSSASVLEIPPASSPNSSFFFSPSWAQI